MNRHLEILVEDSSGKVALGSFLPKIVSAETTFKIHSYRGIGNVPKNLNHKSDPRKRILLDRIPRILGGYGRAFLRDPPEYVRAVIVVCDLDERDLDVFRREIMSALEQAVGPMPKYALCFAIEEGEAWLLGDEVAVTKAYPGVSRAELLRYVPDSVCGTWEFLADLVEKGGSKFLKKAGYVEVGNAKHRWASSIAPLVEPDRNRSPSFLGLVETVKSI